MCINYANTFRHPKSNVMYSHDDIQKILYRNFCFQKDTLNLAITHTFIPSPPHIPPHIYPPPPPPPPPILTLNGRTKNQAQRDLCVMFVAAVMLVAGVAFCFHVFRFAGGAILFLSPFFHSLQVSLSLSLSLSHTHTHTHTYKVSDLIYTYSLPENNSAF